MTSVKAEPKPTLGRPRSAYADKAIQKASLRLLARDGYANLSVVAVAKSAGVSTATIYRRWPTKQALVIDVLKQFYVELPYRETGDFRTDILEFLAIVVHATSRPVIAKTLPMLLASVRDDKDLAHAVRAAIVEPRRKAAIALVARAIDRGELRRDVDPEIVVDALTGLVIYRTWMLHRSVPSEVPTQLVDTLLRGVQA